MARSRYAYGICGVYCGQCPSGNGRIKEFAGELKRMTADFGNDFPDFKEFNFNEFQKGLEWFNRSPGCPTCLMIKEPWCKVLKCEKAQQLKSCLLCDEFLTCSNTEYQRNRYPFVLNHYQRVREVGLEQHLEEEEKRSKQGVSLIDIREY
ncbi:MAG: DUF3795 domain-containing protein [Candidatus Odinarchaeota archaeon]